MAWELTGRSGRSLKVADATPAVLGVHDDEATAPYVPRDLDDTIENALGADRPLVVLRGDRLSGASRALHRGLRRMLGDRLLLPITDPHTADLTDVLRRARTLAARSGPVVVVADDAPPALLDQIDAEVLKALTPVVRLVLTTRRTFLDAHLAPATRARLTSALITVPPGRDGRPVGEDVRPVTRARTILDPVGWSSLLPLGLLRTAVDWDRLGVGDPLTPRLLAELAPVHLAALGAPTPEPDALRRAVRDLVRGHHGGLRLLRETRRGGTAHVVPDRLFSHLADGEAGGWAVPEAFARELWSRLGPEERARATRVALARGEDQVALWLATQVPPDDLEPEALYRIGVTLAERSAAHTPEPGRWDRGALNWLTAALDRADDDLVPRAHRMILLLESRLDPDVDVQVPQARTPADDEGPRLIWMREVARA